MFKNNDAVSVFTDGSQVDLHPPVDTAYLLPELGISRTNRINPLASMYTAEC